jgi:hypothetical protein
MKISSKRVVMGLNILVVAALGVLITVAIQGQEKQSIEPSTPSPINVINSQPMRFVENQGQWDPQVAYMARKQGMTAWLQKDRITFQFEKRDAPDHAQGITMQMTFENASEWVSLTGEEKQLSKHNYFIGNDRSQWRSGVSSYAQVVYRNLYEGVDLRMREAADWLEYDLLLSQGADLSDVVICLEGLKGLHIDENGNLVLETEFGPITQEPATAWYETSSGDRIPVACNFRLIDAQRYGFSVENDLGLALVIDPGLEWSTFLGGNNDDHCISLGLTATGQIIITGATMSVDFPTTPGAYDTTFSGSACDGFVSCLSADGSQLLWSTAIGGNSADVLFDVALDGSGRVIVAGSTYSSDFPTTPGAYDTTHNGTSDGMIVCLSSDGSQLLYSTYLGSAAQDMIVALDVSNAGDAVVGGYTGSVNFPTTTGAYDTTYNGGARDAFVTRITADGTALVYSTYIGGSNDDGNVYQYPIIENSDLMCVLLDNSENAIISGATRSTDFPTTPNAYDTTWNGGYWDIFVAKFAATGSELIFSTYLGGSSWEAPLCNSMCLSENGLIGIGGSTASTNFPTTQSAFDTTFNGDLQDAIVALLDPTGSQLLYSTFIGGPATYDVLGSLAFDMDGDILFTGQADSDFPTTPGAYDTTLAGDVDAFVARLSPEGNGQADLIYSSYIGGASDEAAIDLAIVDDSTVVLVGFTVSSNFPTTSGAYDTSYGGVQDGFALRFGAYVGVQEQNMTKPQSSIALSPAYPNPSHGTFAYSISMPTSGRVNVYVVDVTGRLVETLMDRQLPAGVHEFSWHPNEKLSSGTYFLVLRTDENAETRKVLLVR